MFEDYADRRGLLLEFIGNYEGLNVTAILLRRRLVFAGVRDLASVGITG